MARTAGGGRNRAGAGGIIGTEIVAKTGADDYTLLMGNVVTHAVNVNLHKVSSFTVAVYAPA